ncbi:MAG: YidC/Oxa1 family membrane protein insertase [Bacteroidota bacterium]
MAILAFLSDIMAKILRLFYEVVPNYGWGIIFLTFLLRLILFPTSINQVRSMEVMKVIQPKLKEIQDKYRDKPEELNRRMMELYREHKYNPLSGCLPLLLQLPFLFALFGLLNNPARFAIDLSNEYFLGILLTAKGGANILGSVGNLVLAVLSALTTFFQQKVMSPPQTGSSESAASMQTTFLYFMPIFFGYITYTMAAAIGIYWVAQNVIGIVQQYVIIKFFLPKAKAGEEESTAQRKSRPKGR